MSDTTSWIEQVAATTTDAAPGNLLVARPELQNPDSIDLLAEAFLKVATDDVRKADRIARAAAWLAERIDDDRCRGGQAVGTGLECQLQRLLRQQR